MFAEFLPNLIWDVLCVFMRMGAALMFMTGFGEPYVPARLRLAIAMALSLMLAPMLGEQIPPLPPQPAALVLIIVQELTVGAFIGLFTQVLMGTLSTAGTIIAFQIGLANAFLFNPATAQQSAIPAAFLGALGVTMIFVSDMHHLLIGAMVRSYDLFPLGSPPPVEDLANAFSRAVAESFVIALQLSAPYLFASMVFYAGLGVLARLMPQVQVFFIMMPVQLLGGFLLILATLSAVMYWFTEYFQKNIIDFLGG